MIDLPQIRSPQHWSTIFAPVYDRVAWSAGLRPLSEAGGGHEYRLWRGFGTQRLVGIVIRRKDGRWIREAIRETSEGAVRHPIDRPSNDWMNGFFRLRPDDLPDGAALPNRITDDDGSHYVLESRRGSDYRTRLYSHFDLSREPADLRMRTLGAYVFATDRKTRSGLRSR